MLKCHGIYYSTCYACSKYLVRAGEEDSGPWEEGANDPATRKEKDKWVLPTLTVAERLPFFFSSQLPKINGAAGSGSVSDAQSSS